MLGKDQQTLISIIIFFGIFAYLWGLDFFYSVGISIAILATLYSPLRKDLIGYWLSFTTNVGRISSVIILTFVYILLLFPISLLYRIRNRDALQLKNKYLSYWHIRDKVYTKEDFIQPW